MFQSIHYVSYDDSFRSIKYKVIDSEFGTEEWVGAIEARDLLEGVRSVSMLLSFAAIIQCYQSKKQDVPYNLALCHRYYAKRHPWYNIGEWIKWCIKYVPQYSEYSEAVKKYLSRFDNLKSFW